MDMSGAGFSLLVFLLAGCAHSVAINAETLSPSALNSAPERYHGQTVMVRGFLTLTPEAQNLY